MAEGKGSKNMEEKTQPLDTPQEAAAGQPGGSAIANPGHVIRVDDGTGKPVLMSQFMQRSIVNGTFHESPETSGELEPAAASDVLQNTGPAKQKTPTDEPRNAAIPPSKWYKKD